MYETSVPGGATGASLATGLAGAKFAVTADVQVFSATDSAPSCDLKLDTTTLDTQTVETSGGSFAQLVLQGTGTAGAGAITMSCSGAGSTFTQFHIQALEVHFP